MNNKNTFILLILVPSIFIFLNFVIGQNDASSISIKSNKNTFIECEPIWIEVEVNISPDISLDKAPDIHPYGDLTFFLIDNTGDTLKDLGGHVTDLYTKEYKNHYYAIFQLQQFFGVPEDFPNSLLAFRYRILPGEYHLQIRLQLQKENKMEYFYSDIAEFTVSKPVGEELNAHRKLIEILEYRFNTKNLTEKFNETYKKIEEFKNLFPNSNYLSKAEDLIIGLSYVNPSFQDTIQTYLLRKIQENPGNYYNMSYVYILGTYYKGQEDTYIDKLNQIAKVDTGLVLKKIIYSYAEEKTFRKSLNK